MRVSKRVECKGFPCADVKPACYIVPNVEVEPGNVSIVLIAEAAPPDLADYYYLI